MGIPVDPEQPSAHYSRLATYCHVCLSLRRSVKPFFCQCLYEHLSVANKVTNDLHEPSCQSIIRWAEDGQTPYCWLCCVLDCRMHSRRNRSGIIRLSLLIEPMVTIILIGLIPTRPLEVLPTSLPSIVLSRGFWATFQTLGA